MTTPLHITDNEETGTDSSDYYISSEEGQRQFDAAARQWMGTSGEEFIRRWEAGEFWEIADTAEGRNRGMVDLILTIPLARQEP